MACSGNCSVFWFKVNQLKATSLNNWPGCTFFWPALTFSYWWVTLALSRFIIIHRRVLWAVLVNTVTWMVLKSVTRTKWRNSEKWDDSLSHFPSLLKDPLNDWTSETFHGLKRFSNIKNRCFFNGKGLFLFKRNSFILIMSKHWVKLALL